MTGELYPVNHCGPESKALFVFDERVVMVPRGSLFSGEFVCVCLLVQLFLSRRNDFFLVRNDNGKIVTNLIFEPFLCMVDVARNYKSFQRFISCRVQFPKRLSAGLFT